MFQTKICSNAKCNHWGIPQPLENFSKHSKFKDGLYCQCKDCKRKADKKYYEENTDKVREIQFNYNKTPEGKAAAKRTREKNIDKIRARDIIRSTEYRENNPEKRKLICKTWKENNRHKHTATEAKRRAIKKCAIPPWADLNKIKEIYKLAKELEKQDGIKRHVDHIIPLQNNLVCGLHIETNLQILTESENCKKSNKFSIR